MIDAHRIASKLWMGSRPSQEACSLFDVVVLMAEEYQPDLKCKRLVKEPIDDAKPDVAEVKSILRAACEVHRARREGLRVLVSCNMGVNRSGVVTALALMLNGATAGEAVFRVRTLRKAVMIPLSNQHYVDLLNGLEPQIRKLRTREARP